MIRAIDHIGIAVESIEESRRFYEALGLQVAAIEEVPHEGVRVALIPVGETRIELLEPTTQDSPISRFLERRGQGLHHVCLGTDDIKEDDRKLRAVGAELLREHPTRGAEGCWVQFVHPKSAAGVLVELSERP
ncbi:MAG: methylmalonyl-CoA epimerase [Thermoanaerobaculia bacterium]